MKYYNAKRYWSKLRPHYESSEVQARLLEDFSKYVKGRTGRTFLLGQTPHEGESVDWWCDHRGRIPGFWNYVRHGACYWLVNPGLMVAQRALPKRTWRIVGSDHHSTVWDGAETLFDLNFLAFGICPDEAFNLATKGEFKVLEPGEFLVTDLCHDPEGLAACVTADALAKAAKNTSAGV
jgi:hypothetical protein